MKAEFKFSYERGKFVTKQQVRDLVDLADMLTRERRGLALTVNEIFKLGVLLSKCAAYSASVEIQNRAKEKRGRNSGAPVTG